MRVSGGRTFARADIVFRRQRSMNTSEWDAGLYTAKHSFVYEYGRELVALLAPQEGEHILDLGCGSGQLTRAIAESGARVTVPANSASSMESPLLEYPDLPFSLSAP